MRHALVTLLLALLLAPGWAQTGDSTTEEQEIIIPRKGTPGPQTERPSGYQQPKAAPARRPEKKGTVPHTYQVWIWQENGDCLWKIAKKVYGDPWMWKKIYLANRDQIDDPRVIYPQQVLVLPSPDEEETTGE